MLVLTKRVCLCQTGFAKRSCESQLPRTSVRPSGRLRPTEGEFVRSPHQSVRSGRTLYHTGARGLAQQQTRLRRLSPPSKNDFESTKTRLHTPPTTNYVLNQKRCVCAPSMSVSTYFGPACSSPAPLAAPCASATQRGVIKDAPAHTANYKLRPQSKTVCVCSVNVRVRLLWTCLLGSCPPRRPLCLSHATWRHCFTAGVEFRMSLLGPLCACAPTHHMTRSR